MKVANFDGAYPSQVGGQGTVASASIAGTGSASRTRAVALILTNQTGGIRSAGDVVRISTVNDESFIVSNASNTPLPVGVVYDTIAVGSNGPVVVEGYAPSVQVLGNAQIGDFLYTSTTAYTAAHMAGSAPSGGAFGYVLADGSNRSPTALIFPTYQSAAISAGSNSTRVSEVSAAGASTTLWSPYDHRHDGIGTITASSSNTMQRGTWNVRAGPGIALNLTDTDGDGEFDTMTIVNTGGGGA